MSYFFSLPKHYEKKKFLCGKCHLQTFFRQRFFFIHHVCVGCAFLSAQNALFFCSENLHKTAHVGSVTKHFSRTMHSSKCGKCFTRTPCQEQISRRVFLDERVHAVNILFLFFGFLVSCSLFLEMLEVVRDVLLFFLIFSELSNSLVFIMVT